MMSLWDALRMNMMISYQELVRTFPRSGCFAFIEKTIQDGDIFVSAIGVYVDKDKSEEVFIFNVGTISEDSVDIFSAASETYLMGFTVVRE
ncbi:hypothetical protein, partial [Klebsiella pneumoniae]|uniref:hypothetical protein n=1 Tax=Klebsiella pneumoniae TaxID=573 RepID=UPI001F2C0C15